MFSSFFLALLVSVTSAQNTPKAQDTFDYVVIGSGPGGGPLSANLAREGYSVLLLEAGEDNGDSLLQQIPPFSNMVAENPTMSWDFFVNHYQDPKQAQKDDKFTWRTKNGEFYVGLDPPAGADPLGILYPRTGTLGGWANHNAMLFVLPPDSTWEAIADTTGDNTWKASNMRRYFEEIEHCNYLPENAPGHGFDGWLGSDRNNLSTFTNDEGYFDVVQTAIKTIEGHNVTDAADMVKLLDRDMNRADPKRYQQEGVFNIPIHEDAMKRRSGAQTYLRDTINELNADGSSRFPLTIKTSSLATKILFDNSTVKPRAVGVEYLSGSALYKADPRYDGTQVGVPMKAFASKEVIVSGGAFNTPQLLKLSGIGPRDELEELDIPVVADVPAVGTNLQDNYEAGVEATASKDFINPLANCTFLAPGDSCLREWEADGSGPYGIGGASVGMLVKSSVSEDEDTDLFFFGAGYGMFRGFYPGFSRATAPPNTWWWSIVRMQMQNRAGTVKLRSKDPQDTPLIDFNFFGEGRKRDLQALTEGVNLARDIFGAVDEPYAPFNVTEPPTDDIRQRIVDEAWGHHASCSCPIGPDGDPASCVDSKFRVQGVESLRVVDASVFPRVPGGFPVLPTFMVSQKVTEIILAANSEA